MSLILFQLACSAGETDINLVAQNAREGSSEDARQLVRAFKTTQRDRFDIAYRTLIEMGAKSEPFLLEGLNSRDPGVFEASAAALGNLGTAQAVPVLISALSRNRPRSYAAAWALGEIGDNEAIPVLVDALRVDDQALRKEAVRALVKIGPVAEGTVAGLLNSGDSATERAAIRVIGELRGKNSVPLLTGIGGDNRDAAVWALGRIGDKRALDTLLGALADERWEVRREAAEALGRLEDIRAAEALNIALFDSETVVREWAARSLETVSGKQVLYRDEDGREVRPYNLYR